MRISLCRFHGICAFGKSLLDCTKIVLDFLLMIIKRMTKWYISILRTNMSSLEFRLKKVDETSNYLLDETNHNDLISEKYKTTCKYSNYFEHLLILVSTVTDCVSISAFASSFPVPAGITSSEVGIKVGAITRGIKNYKSIVLLEKAKSNAIDTIEVLISTSLIYSNISHDEFAPANNVLREYHEIKRRNKKSWNRYVPLLYKYGWYMQRNLLKIGIERIVDNDGKLWLNEKNRRRIRSWKFARNYNKTLFKS